MENVQEISNNSEMKGKNAGLAEGSLIWRNSQVLALISSPARSQCWHLPPSVAEPYWTQATA